MEEAIGSDLVGAIGLPVAPLVRGDHMVARCGEGWQLMAPGVPQLGEAVTQQDQRPLTLLRDMHVDAIRPEDPVVY